jgi:cytochrome c-type biogenesis protein CcmH/NrfF
MRAMWSRRYLSTAVCLLLTLGAGPAAADPADVAAKVSSEIMSPYCEGVTLHDCASGAAVQMRQRIENWARLGWSEERILDRIEAEWGEGIRAAPKTEGLGLLAWILPLAALGSGAVIAALVGRRWRHKPRPEQPAERELSASDRARLETELAGIKDQG